VFTARYELNVYITVLFRLVSGLSRWWPGFDPRPVLVRCVVEKVAVGQFFLPVLLFPPDSVIPYMLYTILICTLLLPEGQMGEAWEPSKEQCSFGNQGTLDTKHCQSLLVLKGLVVVSFS
jgi:hypothetical protein